jgi:SNF2 family DNA or RNA helicase
MMTLTRQNNVQELYSLFKFLRIKPLNDRQSFEIQIAKPLKTGRNAGQAMKKLRVGLLFVHREYR